MAVLWVLPRGPHGLADYVDTFVTLAVYAATLSYFIGGRLLI
jgi:hypothetical protein